MNLLFLPKILKEDLSKLIKKNSVSKMNNNFKILKLKIWFKPIKLFMNKMPFYKAMVPNLKYLKIFIREEDTKNLLPL
jgi:hypothetical protein